MTFRVRLTREAESDARACLRRALRLRRPEPSAAKAQVDLDRLFDFVLERELARAGGDLELAEQALLAIRSGVATLKASPFTCRKVGQSPFLRELIIPFGRSGYVALFETVDNTEVVVSALRHQIEDDFH